MASQLRAFWERFQTGIEVAVGSSEPHKLLGTRDGFLRYFRQGLHSEAAVALVPHPEVEQRSSLPMSDDESVHAAALEARELEDQLGTQFHFFVGNEGGLHSVEVDGHLRYFVRSWTVIRCAVGEAWGGSGSIQLPDRMVEGLDHTRRSPGMSSRRRSGGLISHLTGGLETRRSAVELATLHALSTLFHGLIESRAEEG